MPLWGTKSGYEFMPNWLTDAEKEVCYATSAGWAIKHPNGTEEVLVSVKGLSTRTGAASITGIKFGTGTYTEGTTKQVKVTFNEKVNVTGAPTIVVTDSEGNNATATYVSSNTNKTVLTFEFTVPVGAGTLSIAAQSLGVAGATIKEVAAPGTTDASVVVTEDVADAAETKTAVAA